MQRVGRGQEFNIWYLKDRNDSLISQVTHTLTEHEVRDASIEAASNDVFRNLIESGGPI